jgi:excisionase family DNA binding protein
MSVAPGTIRQTIAAMSEQPAARADSGHEPSRTPDTIELSGLISARQAATALDLSERTIRRAIQRGDLAATILASHCRISADEIKR